MKKIFKRKQEPGDGAEARSEEDAPITSPSDGSEPLQADEHGRGGILSRLKKGLKRTGSSFADGMGTFLLGKKEIDDDVMDELETALLVADVGVEATTHIVDHLSEGVKRKELTDGDALFEALSSIGV